MQENKVLKQLLAVSAVASMFGAFQAHAQTSSSTTPSVQELNMANTGTTNMDGKTARDGTVGNTNSQGMDERANARDEQATSATGTSGQGSTAAGTSSSQGSTATGTSGSHSGMHGSDAATGATGATGAAGQTMTDKTPSGAPGTAAQDMSGQTSTGAAAAGQTAASGKKLSKADQKIVMDMARANMAEIEAGKLALSKSQDEQVKSFAQQMVDDHTKALADVQTLAQEKGVTLPTGPDAKHKAMAAKMEKLSGDAFNREYIKQAGVADHKKVYATLQKYHTSAKDPDVKVVAGKLLPTVEQHLKAAQALATSKGTTSAK